MLPCLGEFYEETQSCFKCPDKEHCKLFGKFLTRTSQTPNIFFDVGYDGKEYYLIMKGDFDHDKLLQICNDQKMFENQENKKRKLAIEGAKVDKFGDKGRLKAGAATKAYWQNRIEGLVNEYKHFRRQLLKKTDGILAKPDVSPKRGQFTEYWLQHKSARPISIYYKNNLFKEVHVCTLTLKTQMNNVDVMINAPLDKFSEYLSLMDIHKLQPIVENIDSRRFIYTLCRSLDREKLSIVAEVVAKIVKEDYFDTKQKA